MPCTIVFRNYRNKPEHVEEDVSEAARRIGQNKGGKALISFIRRDADRTVAYINPDEVLKVVHSNRSDQRSDE